MARSGTHVACALLALGWLASDNTALAQQPSLPQPVEIVVPFGAGGGADLMARQMARILEPIVGAPFVVSNIPGASGNAGLTRVLTNPPDGQTMAVLVSVTVSAWASGVGYARADDFAVLALPQQSASMLFVPSDSAFRSFRELLEHARASPGRIKVATAGYGSSDDITLRYFESLGYRMGNVPYARPDQRYASAFNKRAHAIYEEPGDVAALLASKRLRPLVVFDTERHPAFEDVPSSRELGFDINDLPNFRMLVVRAGTPAERQAALVKAIGRAFETPEWKKFCAETFSCARAYTPEQATQRVRAFFETGRKYLKQPAAVRP